MSGVRLADLQQWVVALMTNGGDGEDVLVVGNAIASAAERFSVYRQGYVSRLVECLADDYAAVRFALGADAFDEYARQYVERFPSTSFSLNGYGQRFPRFLAETPTEVAIIELACLEWAVVEVIHAPNAPASTSLAAVSAAAGSPAVAQPSVESPNAVRLTSGPAVRLFPTRYRVAEYCRLLMDGQQVVPVPHAGYVLVTRRDYAVYKRDVEPEAGRVLSELLQERPLDAALDGVTVSPETAQNWFAEWVRVGALRLT